MRPHCNRGTGGSTARRRRNLDTKLLEALDLPGLGVRRHVDGGLEAERARSDPDTQAEIARAANGDGVFREEGPGFRGGQLADVFAIGEEPAVPGKSFGKQEDLVDAAAGLDRASDREVAVCLDV
jgi:hypothetical protein